MLQTFGRFRIEKEIGRGAVGRVFVAYDDQIDRRVAIKTLSVITALPDAEREEARERFLREARAAGRLSHPHIVTVFDVGEEGGIPYIAMEYLEGVGLDRFTREPDLLPPARAAHLLADAADALDYAHARGLVHRDIKPANLMLVGGRTVKITDFGLAKAPEQHLTSDGTLVGTPYYMSPEQFAGQPLDGRTDLFSLGVVLYELLTGTRPFRGDSVSTVMYRILNEEPEAPSAVRPGVPAAFDMIIAHALAKEPGSRYQTGGEMAGALRAAAEGEGAVAVARAGSGARRSPPPAPGPRSVDDISAGAGPARVVPPAPRRIRTGWVTAIVVVGLLGVLAAVGAVWWWPQYGKAWWASRGAPAELPPEGGPPPPVAGGRDVIRIPLKVDPEDAEVVAEEGALVEKGRVVFDAARTTSFVIRARARCRDATYTWESSMPVPEEIAIEVPSGPVPVPVSSAPPGAAIFVDGKDAGLVTPADVPLDPCGTQSVTLRLAAYREWSYLPGSPPATDWSASLRDVALEALPPGILVLQRAPYSVDVFEGRGRVARFTTQGGRVNLAPGRHSLQVRNAERMVSVPVTVDVASGDTARLDVPWPPLSTIRIIAVPGNCTAEVVGDGGATRDLGPTPTEATLGPGTYTVRVRYVATGELQTKRIQLAGGANPAPLRFVFQP